MNFNEVVNEVMLHVKRPDKLATIRMKVNAAISFYCLDNQFSRDFKEQLVTIDSAEHTQAIAIGDLQRFRRLKYIKRGGTKNFLKLLPDSDLFKTCENRDTYYIVGDNININTAVLCANVDIGYYQYPPVLSPASANFWLLDVAPYMVIERALSEVWRDIDEDKASAKAAINAREAYAAARKDLGISTQ